MRRLNDYLVYELGMKLAPLASLKDESTYREVLFTLWEARAIVMFVQRYFPLRICQDTAWRLTDAITAVVPESFDEASKRDADEAIGYRSYTIRKAKEEFQVVLSAELNSLDTYLLTQQGIYSTADLVERADIAFSEETRQVIPEEARKDFREAGRCLAFELPTASGFHTMRATEAVLRQYHRLVLNLPATQKCPDMATCINELRAKNEDAKLMSILDQIRDLQRNPQMHPEVFLTIEESVRLFDIAKSAINAMADRITALAPPQEPQES